MQKHRNSRKKTFFLILLILLMLLSSTIPSYAAAPELPSLSGAGSVYLWNAEYDKVIVSKSESEIIYPASMTKLMTGIVAIELIGDRLDEKVTISSEMIKGSQGTSMGLKNGEVVSFRDLLYGALCGGFNDAAMALAATSAGSVTAFVDKMNEKAQILGAHNTHYTNPTGWHDDKMVTSLTDTAIIAKQAMKNELFVTVSSAQKYEVDATNRSDGFTIHNRNGLISSHYAIGYYNKRAKGLCAGMTDEGGYCVATFAVYDDLTYLCIVMGADEQDDVIRSYDMANDLITHSIYYFDEVEAIKSGDIITRTPLHYAAKGANDDDFYMLPCTVSENVTVFASFDYSAGYELELCPFFFSDELAAPVSKGDTIGGVDVFVDGILCGTAPLCAAEDVEANPFLVTLSSAKELITSRGFIAFAIAFALMFAIYFYYKELRTLQKRKKRFRYDRPF